MSPIEQYTIDWKFSPIWGWGFHVFGGQKNENKKNSQIDIMQIFSADPTTFSKELKIKNFTPKTWKIRPQKLLSFFSIANRPKTSPDHIFCSIKMSPCATSI